MRHVNTEVRRKQIGGRQKRGVDTQEGNHIVQNVSNIIYVPRKKKQYNHDLWFSMTQHSGLDSWSNKLLWVALDYKQFSMSSPFLKLKKNVSEKLNCDNVKCFIRHW